MNDSVWTFEELSRDCDGHYCMADGKDYPALCRYEENMTGHPLGDVCGADCMGECSERFCPSEEVRRLIGKPTLAVRRGGPSPQRIGYPVILLEIRNGETLLSG